jgi:hypothetical protein
VKFLSARQLEPRARKGELRTLQFRQSQEFAVKRPRFFQIRNRRLKVVEGRRAHEQLLRLRR